jgi:uncharacterized membrane protein SpoIIM required for sporulation
MRQRRFEALHRPEWDELAHQLDRLEKRYRRHDRAQEAPADLPRRHRRLCHQQALACERGYSLSLIRELEQLMLRSHRQLYRQQPPLWSRLGGLIRRDFPRSVREQGPWNLVSALVFVGAAALVAVLVHGQPDMVHTVLDAKTKGQLEQNFSTERSPDRSSADDLRMFGFYIMNNIGVAFRSFASGLFLGVGSLFIMVFNGAFLGAAGAHLVNIEQAEPFFGFIIAHGAPELTAIVLAGGAGLRLGWALVAPGPRRRLDALREAAIQTLPVIYGVILLLLAAAFIEAFWSPRQFPLAWKLGVGAGLWALVLGYLALGGRGVDGERS